MKCDIEGCIHKAKWIVDDNGVDTNLCANHIDEFREAQRKMNKKISSVGVL